MNIRLKGFRIQNYKIIHDSGFCSVNERITTLIGKNESGKTIILEGLKQFNYGIDISEEYRPQVQYNGETIITTVFEIPSHIINTLFQKIGFAKQFYHSVEVELRKHYPYIYRLSPEQKKEWGFPKKNDKLEKNFIDRLLPLLPRFFFLESQDNTFPPKMGLENAEKHPWYPPLSKITDFRETANPHSPRIEKPFPSLDDLESPHLKKINVTVIPECQWFYDSILKCFYYLREGNSIAFVVKDKKVVYPLDRLNRHQRWYLSFYLKAAYAITMHSNPIFLIDEPGILIHSHSQTRLLSKLEQFSTYHQILFSTHSPYLINSEKIHRIRLVEKTIDGTQIIERIYAVKDVETLSPVMAAIGLNTSPINNIGRQRNVIVEGVSDLYYMEAFKRLTGEDKIHFIFGGGAGNMSKVGTILRGWGCDILYLYDNDKGGLDAEKNLKKYWLFGERDVVYVVEPEGTIEDIFHPDDFRRIILEDPSPYSESNSTHVKRKNINKVTSALKFKEYLEVIKNPKLHPVTLKNITYLFKTINDRFEDLEKKQLKKLSRISRREKASRLI